MATWRRVTATQALRARLATLYRGWWKASTQEERDALWRKIDTLQTILAEQSNLYTKRGD